MDIGPAHGESAYLSNLLAVRPAKPSDEGLRKAPRLASWIEIERIAGERGGYKRTRRDQRHTGFAISSFLVGGQHRYHD